MQYDLEIVIHISVARTIPQCISAYFRNMFHTFPRNRENSAQSVVHYMAGTSSAGSKQTNNAFKHSRRSGGCSVASVWRALPEMFGMCLTHVQTSAVTYFTRRNED